MIVVLADLADGETDALVEAWGAEAALVGVDDLSRPGWVAEFPQAGPAFVADGQRRATRDLTGVLVRLPAVRAEHLPHIAEADRDYAAAEMTAFLAYWLSALECPVVNRPTPSLLMGPAWTVVRWLALARDLGIAGAQEPGGPAERWVTAVGGRAFPAEDPAAPAAVALARQAGVSLLGLGFAGDRLITVSLRPLLTSEVADALRELLS